MSEVIVITSGKGGVGKTTTVANIGTGLAAMGKRVAVVDTDIGLRNLDVVMGLENRIVYNLVDVINGSCRLKQALIRDRRHQDLYLLPSAQTKDKTAVSPEQMIKLTDDLREEFDYVLLDCPAGIEQGFKNAVAGADRALVVTTPEVSAIRDADRIIGLLESGGIRDIRLIINRLRPGDYVKSWDEFEFLPGAQNALTKCNAMFCRILVVTNQRGVGKGLMTRQALDEIHRRMLQTIAAHGGRIDKIYCCTGLSENDPCRKPNIGMALQAQKEFPEIDFASALMVGDTSSDLLFGRNAGMHTVLIGEDDPQADYISLHQFSASLL